MRGLSSITLSVS